MIPILLSLLPTIFSFVLNRTGSVIDETSKASIVSKVLSLGKDVSGSSILETIEGVIGNIESEKRALIQADIESLLGQVSLDTAEIQSSKPWYLVPHEIAEMCADVYLGMGFLLALVHMLLFSFGIIIPFCGYDNVTVGLALSFSGLVKGYKMLNS